MKISKKCLVENIASDDARRSAMVEPYLDITDGKGTIIATDGAALAAIPVEIDPSDTAGSVSAAALKSARKQVKNLPDAVIGLNGVATLADGSTMPRHGDAPAGATFPNWRAVVPKDPAPVMVLQLDAKLLWQLAQSMGTQGVRLVIEGASKPITVEPWASGTYAVGRVIPACEGARGVIMPIAPAKSCNDATGLREAAQ